MDSVALDQLAASAGSMVGVQLLKEAQNMAGQQAAQLIEGMPAPQVSTEGRGDLLDITV